MGESHLILERKLKAGFESESKKTHQALAHILWKTKRWRDVLLVGRSTERARRTTLGEGNGENTKTEPPNEVRQPAAETSRVRKEESGHGLKFVNKVFPSPESDTESIEEAENHL